MTENNVEIDLQIDNCKLRICGSESFVEKKFQELENKYLQSDTKLKRTQKNKTVTIAPNDEHTIADLYSINPETGKLSIHGKVPGSSKSERTKNVALITLHCKTSEDPISNIAIKEACISQACLDPKNFATTIKKDKEDFIISGKGSDWSVDLTIFGKQKAQSLMEKMLNEQLDN